MQIPNFQLSPQGNGHYQMLAYSLFTQREYFFRAPSARAARSRANAEAIFEHCPFFRLRDGRGQMLYDGPTRDALGAPLPHPGAPL